jgi:hypothetical protein
MSEKVDAGFSQKHCENKGIQSRERFNRIAIDSSRRERFQAKWMPVRVKKNV